LPLLVLLALPVVVTLVGLHPAVAAALVGLILLWRWVLTMGGLVARRSGPDLVLETIPASHFVEKVRWALDRLGLDFREQPDIGTVGVLFLGRTVPRLQVRTGAVTSAIGNSSDILRYLWGRYSAERPAEAAFLEPTPEAVELERRLDKYGAHLQRWIYARVLAHRRVCIYLWGGSDPAVPRWQRIAIRVLFPLQRAFLRRVFHIRPSSLAKSVAEIEEVLGWVEERLADGRQTLLGGGQTSFVDLTFASLSGIWVLPTGYGGGRAEAVIPIREQIPAAMVADMDSWRERFPAATAFVERLYADRGGIRE
jgi:glutathione S-transferase